MEVEKIKQLIELMQAAELAELELQEHDGEKIRLLKAQPQAISPATEPLPPFINHTSAAKTNTAAVSGSSASSQPSIGEVFRSPMVGTFYRAPSPNSPPFIQLGQEVKKGDVLCIIESMKMMNRIESDRDGKIISILVENSDPVEFNQPLLTIG